MEAIATEVRPPKDLHDLRSHPLDFVVQTPSGLAWVHQNVVDAVVSEAASERASELEGPNSVNYDTLCESEEAKIWDELERLLLQLGGHS